jgi:hypothetical protein
MWKRYCFIQLLLCIVITLATCVPVIALYHYHYRKIGSVIASLSYRFWNIGTGIACISYSSGNIGYVIASESYALRRVQKP